MIRALQIRVNRRTERYSKLVDGEQASKQDVQDALRRLSEQEARVHKVTRDLELGKNNDLENCKLQIENCKLQIGDLRFEIRICLGKTTESETEGETYESFYK